MTAEFTPAWLSALEGFVESGRPHKHLQGHVKSAIGFIRSLQRKVSELEEVGAGVIHKELRIGLIRQVLHLAFLWVGGWREMVAELENYCSEPVRLKAMTAVLDQMDEWKKTAQAALEREAP